MLWSSTALTRAGQAHLWGQGPWGGAQGMMLERHGLQGHLPGLGRGGGGEQAGPCSGAPRSLSGTYQKHSLFVDEGLLQSQRGGIQTWDWGEPGQRAWIPRCRS